MRVRPHSSFRLHTGGTIAFVVETGRPCTSRRVRSYSAHRVAGRRPHHGCRVIRACLARVQTPGGPDEDET